MTYEQFCDIKRGTILRSRVTGRTYHVTTDAFNDMYKEPAIRITADVPEETDFADETQKKPTNFIVNLMEDGNIGGCVDELEYNYEEFDIVG